MTQKQRIVIFHAHIPERVRMAERLSQEGNHVLLHSEQAIPAAASLARDVNVQVRYGTRVGMCQMADRVIL